MWDGQIERACNHFFHCTFREQTRFGSERCDLAAALGAGSPGSERRPKEEQQARPSAKYRSHFLFWAVLKPHFPLGTRPIFNKTEDKVVCVRKMQASGNIISDPPWPPARRELSGPEFLKNVCVVCRGCGICYSSQFHSLSLYKQGNQWDSVPSPLAPTLL